MIQENDQLKLIAFLYFNDLDISDEENGMRFRINRKKVKEELDENGIIGWDWDKQDVIKVVSN